MNQSASNSRSSATKLKAVQSAPACPLCGEGEVTTTITPHTFEYGTGESSVELHVRLPVGRCDSCGFEFLDDEAELLKHRAICEYLDVLAPEEIREIRIGHRMTRAQFASVTGLGGASLNRWENGLSIQTRANDRYLRLLSHPENISRLETLKRSRFRDSRRSDFVANQFRTITVTDAMREEQAYFHLRLVA
ncbi:MAG: YgiT-type zinc finger protein [bacterium]|nr:YgiT-type zinc finger protein [bacterium]